MDNLQAQTRKLLATKAMEWREVPAGEGGRAATRRAAAREEEEGEALHLRGCAKAISITMFLNQRHREGGGGGRIRTSVRLVVPKHVGSESEGTEVVTRFAST